MNRSLLVVVAVGSLLFSAPLIAQDGGGGGNVGGNTGGGDNSVVPAVLPTTNNTGGGNTGTTGQGRQIDPNAILNSIFSGEEIAVQEDERQQNFVGNRSDLYFHPYSFYNENGLGSIGQGGAGRTTGGRGGGGGAQNFFVVTRRSIRSRVRATFAHPTVPNNVRSQAYNNRLARIPGMATVSNSVRMQVNGRVATLTGTVRTKEQKGLVERQARLEPGVFQIVNQIKIAGN